MKDRNSRLDISVSSVLEGFVILRKNPDAEPEDKKESK